MYNNGNSSKNVTGSSIVDGTVETADLADDAVTVDKLANAINTDIATGVSGSTTADAALPKAGGTMTGTIAGFTSTGIDDNATSTAITIDSSENVGISVTPKTWNTIKGLQFGNSGAMSSWSNNTVYSNNAYYASGWKHIVTGASSQVNQNGSGDIILSTAPSAAADASAPLTTRLAVDNLGDVTVNTGNLVMGTSGKGIDFSAATPDGTGSTGSEVLDDYEEGTWTPVLSDGTNNATMTASTYGTYTKVGDMVYLSALVETSSLGSVSGGLRINGLPFTTNSTANYRAAASLGYTRGLATTAGVSIAGTVDNGVARIDLSLRDLTSGVTAMLGTEWTADGLAILSLAYKV